MTDKWTGGTGNWLSDPGDWSTGAAPGARAIAQIGVANSFVTLGAATTVAGVTISASTATLDIYRATGADLVTGAFVNAGTLEVEDSVGLKVEGDFTNTGSLDLDTRFGEGGSALTILATLVNSNSVRIGNSGIDATETVTLGGLTNGSKASFSVEGAQGHDVALSFSPGGANFANNAGSFSLEYTSSLVLAGNFRNSGGFFLENASTVAVKGGFVNIGNVDIHENTDMTVGGNFTNKGTLNFDSNFGADGGALAIAGMLFNTKSARIGNSDLSTIETVRLGGLSNGANGTCDIEGSAAHKLRLEFIGANAGIKSNSGTLTLIDVSGFSSMSRLVNSGYIALEDDGSVVIDDVVRSNDVEIHDNTALNVRVDFNNFGTFDFDNSYGNGGGSLSISGLLKNSKLVRIGNSDLKSIETATLGSLSNASKASVVLSGPTLMALVTGSTMNDGTIQIEAGATLSLDGTAAGSGVDEVSMGTLVMNGASSENVSFALGGLLELTDSRVYTGSISGFARNGSTVLDLSDVSFIEGSTTAIFTENIQKTGGTLAVSDGLESVNISLVGLFPSSKFTASDDGQGGTSVKAVPDDTARMALADVNPSAFASAMAGLGAHTGDSAGHASEASSSWRAQIAHPLTLVSGGGTRAGNLA